jgi:hypothetical protein
MPEMMLSLCCFLSMACSRRRLLNSAKSSSAYPLPGRFLHPRLSIHCFRRLLRRCESHCGNQHPPAHRARPPGSARARSGRCRLIPRCCSGGIRHDENPWFVRCAKGVRKRRLRRFLFRIAAFAGFMRILGSQIHPVHSILLAAANLGGFRRLLFCRQGKGFPLSGAGSAPAWTRSRGEGTNLNLFLFRPGRQDRMR